MVLQQKIRIEYSRYCRKYFVFNGNSRGFPFVTTRKDQAIRHAKSLGATDFTIHNRNVLNDLTKYKIMTKGAAIRWLKEQGT